MAPDDCIPLLFLSLAALVVLHALPAVLRHVPRRVRGKRPTDYATSQGGAYR